MPGAPFITEGLTQKISQATAAARYAQISAVQTDALDFALDTSGAANSIVAALNPVINTLTQGMSVVITIANNNTGPSTLNLNGLGAKNIVYKGNALVGGELLAGHNAEFSYNGATWDLMSNPANQTLIYTGGTVQGYGTEVFCGFVRVCHWPAIGKKGRHCYRLAENRAHDDTPVKRWLRKHGGHIRVVQGLIIHLI